MGRYGAQWVPMGTRCDTIGAPWGPVAPFVPTEVPAPPSPPPPQGRGPPRSAPWDSEDSADEGGGEAVTSGDPGGPEAPRRSERRALRPRLRHCEEAASPAGSEGEAEGAAPSGEEGYGLYGVLWGDRRSAP